MGTRTRRKNFFSCVSGGRKVIKKIGADNTVRPYQNYICTLHFSAGLFTLLLSYLHSDSVPQICPN